MNGIGNKDYEWLQSYARSSKLQHFYRTHKIEGDKISTCWYGFHEMDPSPIYVVVGDERALTLAFLCGVLTPSDKDRPWRAAMIPPAWLDGSNPELDANMGKWIAQGNCKLDVRDPSCPITMRDDQPPNFRSRYRPWLAYSGDIPKRIAMSYAKTVFSETVANYWSGNFIVGSDQRTSKKLSGLARSKMLAKAIMLGEHEIDVPLGGHTGTKFTGLKADTLMTTTFDISKMTPEAQAIVKSVQVFRDYAELWNQAIEDDHFFAMRVDEKDLEERPEEVIAAFKRGAEFIGLEAYLEPYRAGVPIEDIICKEL